MNTKVNEITPQGLLYTIELFFTKYISQLYSSYKLIALVSAIHRLIRISRSAFVAETTMAM